MSINRIRNLKKFVLIGVVAIGPLAGIASCGGSNDGSSPDAAEQALIELLVDAAQRGADDEFASIVAQADPDLIAKVLPEVEDELGLDAPGTNPPTDASQPDPAVADPSDEEGSDAPNSTSAGSTDIDLGLPDGLDTGGIDPSDVTVAVPSLPAPNLPTTNAPSISSPKISVPGPSTLPAANLPTTATIQDVRLLTVRGERQLEVLISGGIWDSATGKRSPETVFVRYRISTGAIKSKYLILTSHLGTNTSIWMETILADADPCSFEIAVSPSTVLQRFRLGDNC